jgi:hypothetical protein
MTDPIDAIWKRAINNPKYPGREEILYLIAEIERLKE